MRETDQLLSAGSRPGPEPATRHRTGRQPLGAQEDAHPLRPRLGSWRLAILHAVSFLERVGRLLFDHRILFCGHLTGKAFLEVHVGGTLHWRLDW